MTLASQCCLLTSFASLSPCKILMFFQPLLGLYHLIGISCGRQDLRNQSVRVKRDGRYKLLQLLWALLQSLSWRLSVSILYAGLYAREHQRTRKGTVPCPVEIVS